MRGKATLPWGNVHGLVSLVAIEGLPGGLRGREAGAAGRVRPPRLLARRVRGVARSTFEETKGCASDR